MNVLQVTNVGTADAITPDWIRAHVDPVAAHQVYLDPQFRPTSGNSTPHHFVMPPLGTWRVDEFGEYEVLITIPTADMVASEGDWEFALRWPETLLYIQWARQGYAPPPITVIRNVQGELRSLNRRRWLAAREADVKEMVCWYSPSHPLFRTRSAYWTPEHGKYYQQKLAFVQAHKLNPADYLGQHELECLLAHAAVQ